jgi:preprotein translocase subunit YajC
MTVAAQPAKQDRTTMALLLIAALVAVGGIGFAVGHLTAGSTAAAANTALGAGWTRRRRQRRLRSPVAGPGPDLQRRAVRRRRRPRRRPRRGVSGGVTGTVQSINGSTMTITLANGTTVTIDLSGTTTYHNATAAASTDVKAGSTVTVQIDTSALAGETSETRAPRAASAVGRSRPRTS